MNYLGSLIIYDLNGKVISDSGETQSTEFIEHSCPVGVPYIILPYGTMKYDEQRLIRIDVSDPENHKPVFEQIIHEKTAEEKLAEAEAKLRELGVTV